jgi:hypothetical protein
MIFTNYVATYDAKQRVAHVYDVSARRGGTLNAAQLLNPLFFSRDVRHPDMKRQRGRRQRAKDLRAARVLKVTELNHCELPCTAIDVAYVHLNNLHLFSRYYRGTFV